MSKKKSECLIVAKLWAAVMHFHFRLDADIINEFKKKVQKAGGGNYQTLINEALHKYLDQQKGHQEPLEKTLRRVIREELCVTA